MKKAVKKALYFLIAGGIVMLTLLGWSAKKFSVDYCGDKEAFIHAKNAYRAGTKVTLCYDKKMIGTDTDYSFFVDSQQINAHYNHKKGFILKFTMPDHNIKVQVVAKNSMYVGADEDTLEYKKNPTLTFDSFDGGGPEYNLIIDDTSIVSFKIERQYSKPNHEEMTGAGYDVIYTFTGLMPGKTGVKVEARSPIADNYDVYYDVYVDLDLNVAIRRLES